MTDYASLSTALQQLAFFPPGLWGALTFPYEIHLVCQGSWVTSSPAASSSSLLLLLRAVCRKKHLRVQTGTLDYTQGTQTPARNRSKLGAEWKKNQLCRTPLLTISAGEGAFSHFCCAWLFWEWHPRQLGLFVSLLSSVLIAAAQRGSLTKCTFGRKQTRTLGSQSLDVTGDVPNHKTSTSWVFKYCAAHVTHVQLVQLSYHSMLTFKETSLYTLRKMQIKVNVTGLYRHSLQEMSASLPHEAFFC